MLYNKEQIDKLKNTVFEFYKQILEMNREYDRKFTMDGHMIGSVGEVFASYIYDIDLFEPGHKLYDGRKGEKNIQIKITQRDYVEVKGVPDYLIVLKIVYCEKNIKIFEVYNGPGRNALPRKNENDFKESSLSINKLSKIKVEKFERIQEVVPISKWLSKIKD